MTSIDLFTEVRHSLWGHRLRTILASLGIVVGVGAVVASLSISEGAKRAALADLATLGLDNVWVRATAGARQTDAAAFAPTLTSSDAKALRSAVSGIASAAVIRLTRAEVAHGRRAALAPVAGVSAAWSGIARLQCGIGRCVSDTDERSARRVAVLGAALARRLLLGEAPVGAVVSISGQGFRVVGVLQPVSRAGATLQAFNADDGIFVPWTVMDLPLGQGDDGQRVSAIGMRLEPGARAADVAKAVAGVLARRHTASESRHEVVVPQELLRARLRTQQTFDAVLLATGLIALTISGIGIMTIMLASVMERQAEIGVRRAVGARRRHIILQFTAESATLCLAGGLLGVPSGAGFAWLVAFFAGWPVAVTVASAVLALALAAGVGLAFGIYPAYRAASVDPIEALRA